MTPSIVPERFFFIKTGAAQTSSPPDANSSSIVNASTCGDMSSMFVSNTNRVSISKSFCWPKFAESPWQGGQLADRVGIGFGAKRFPWEPFVRNFGRIGVLNRVAKNIAVRNWSYYSVSAYLLWRRPCSHTAFRISEHFAHASSVLFPSSLRQLYLDKCYPYYEGSFVRRWTIYSGWISTRLGLLGHTLSDTFVPYKLSLIRVNDDKSEFNVGT